MPFRKSNFKGSVRRQAGGYKWCGLNLLKTVETTASTATNEVVEICPDLSTAEMQGDVRVERILINLNIRRLLVSGIDAFGWMVADQKIVPSTGLVSEVLPVLDTTNSTFTLGNRDLYGIGLLPVPPKVLQSDNTEIVDGRVLVERIDLKPRKTLHRLNHALTFTVAADVTAVL